MSLCGTQYSEEIDEIERLVAQHLEKYGAEDMEGAIERIFTAIQWGMKYNLELKNSVKK